MLLSWVFLSIDKPSRHCAAPAAQWSMRLNSEIKSAFSRKIDKSLQLRVIPNNSCFLFQKNTCEACRGNPLIAHRSADGHFQYLARGHILEK